MKVNFDCPMEQTQVSHSIPLKPGENDLPDEIAQELIAGSDALVAGTAKVKGISEEEARKSLKGKGLFTAVKSLAAPTTTKKRERGGEG